MFTTDKYMYHVYMTGSYDLVNFPFLDGDVPRSPSYGVYSLETSAFEELGSELINFASSCAINTLRLIVYLTRLSI